MKGDSTIKAAESQRYLESLRTLANLFAIAAKNLILLELTLGLRSGSTPMTVERLIVIGNAFPRIKVKDRRI